jgi:hypothetical protein
MTVRANTSEHGRRAQAKFAWAWAIHGVCPAMYAAFFSWLG